LFRELDGLPLVLPSAPNPLRAALDEHAKAQHISLQIVVEADSLPIQKNLVAGGEVYAVLGMPSIQREIKEGTLRSSRIIDPVIRRTGVIATTRHHPFTLSMRTVVRLLEPLTALVLDQITESDSV
jgi:DNA-binding transcriptional LysR family regulator